MTIDKDNISVFYVNLPYKVKGFTLFDGFMHYTIMLNSRLSYDTQIETLNHELSHIYNEDFRKCHDVDLLETQRHN